MQEQEAPDIQASTGEATSSSEPRPDLGWSEVWQIPAILASAGLIAAGVFVATQRAPGPDFDGVLVQVENQIAMERFEEASASLREVIQPHLPEASILQRARFHALVADWIVATMDAGAVTRDREHNEQVDEYYGTAVDLGLVLTPARIERWAHALIDLGRLDVARERLDELDALDLANAESDIRDRRNRVLRRLIERTLVSRDLSAEENLALLDNYRQDVRLSLHDRLWATARQAELRLESGRPDVARDHLLVELRRLERRFADHPSGHPGELIMLLGRAYFDLGERESALFHLQRALEVLRDTDAVRGDALVLLGYLAMDDDELERAADLFTTVVETFHDTRSHLAGILGRAEVRSMLGHHDFAIEDYDTLQSELEDGQPRRDIDAERVARSLLSRHNAVLPSGRLDLALRYAERAEAFFSDADVPVEILSTIAHTSEMIAHRQLGDAWDNDGPTAMITSLPADRRHEARLAFERAATYYARHAQSIVLQAGSDDDWAYSLRRAALSYDFAGRPDLAIPLFEEYLERRSSDDGSRNEMIFRLAQALQAELRHDEAVEWYERLIDDTEAGPYATRSFTPLARCYVAIDRPRDAEVLLRNVLDGKLGSLLPEAADYKDALIELGRLKYNSGAYVDAIELLTEARKRCADDRRIVDITYQLADSHRRFATELNEQYRNDVSLTPMQREVLRQRRATTLLEAQALFDDVIGAYRAIPLDRRSVTAQRTLRLASLYRADIAFERTAYVEAIELYDGVAREFRDHPASIHALIQIVNCYAALGNEAEKIAAHERAVFRLDQMPDGAFDQPDALLNRAAWENWLRNLPVGLTSAATTDTAVP